MRTRLFGWHTIYGDEGESRTPYMFRAWIWRLRLHVFYRGDADPDPHDHPWDFRTFPLVSYVEEVTRPSLLFPGVFYKQRQVVRAFRWHHRPAEHLHRVIGAFDGWWVTPEGFLYIGEPLGDHDEPQTDGARIVTLVWRGKGERRWGFLKHRDSQWCWTHWKEYALRGGKQAPCAPVVDEAFAGLKASIERDVATFDAEFAEVKASIAKGARRAPKSFRP